MITIAHSCTSYTAKLILFSSARVGSDKNIFVELVLNIIWAFILVNCGDADMKHEDREGVTWSNGLQPGSIHAVTVWFLWGIEQDEL